MKPISLLSVLVLLLAGCTLFEPRPEIEAPIGPVSSDSADGLTVQLEVAGDQLTTGERFDVKVTAINLSNAPITIPSRSGALVYVRLFRHTGLYWQEVKRYPQAETTIMSPWTLQANSRRTFEMQLTVEPDWPTGEPLLMTAELNGRKDVAPSLTLNVHLPVTVE